MNKLAEAEIKPADIITENQKSKQNQQGSKKPTHGDSFVMATDV
jgi:hypothetical protein